MSTEPFSENAKNRADIRAASTAVDVSTTKPPTAKPPTAKPQRAVSPRLRIVLFVVLGLFSLMAANGIYLSTITFSEWMSGLSYQNYFYQFMFLGHLILGAVILVPVIAFGFYHWKASRHRRNRRAVKIGYGLLGVSLVLLVSGVLLTRIGSFGLNEATTRSVIYWAHVITPLMAIWLYWLHRLVGPRIKWYVGRRIAVVTAVFVGTAVIFQMQDPRDWGQTGPKDPTYFEPSLARTATGQFIRAEALMNDDYCKRCHEEIVDDWFHSAHHFSSFNNPAYLYSVRETRKSVLARDGNIKASRWCAGCHDPVPFFSGAFDAEDYDDVNHPTSQAGITCTVCHAITHVNSNKGNADYVIEEPTHYPFAYSKNPMLQQLNSLLVKAKPAFHKAEMLKPVHKETEFCSTCHKVHLPKAVTAYKDFLRGQNHYDSAILSGVMGGGARSFYYPPHAEDNCNGCHMPLKASNGFGAEYSPQIGGMAVHDHSTPGANTALPFWRGDTVGVALAERILKDCARVDLFGIRDGGKLEDSLIAPLRPSVPALKAGNSYLLETIIRTLKVGHHFTQGTVDSNEVWLEIIAESDGQTIGVSGGMDDRNAVDPWSHFVSNFMLDKQGNRIERRNAEDIFVALYNHQIPPGAGQVSHYQLLVPEDIHAPISVTVRLKYRKFTGVYMDFMDEAFLDGDHEFAGRESPGLGVNELPITIIAEDRVVFPVETKDGTRIDATTESSPPPEPLWQRWNDYGIGLLLTGNGQLKQAAEAFAEVEALGRFDGPMNSARVYLAEGNQDAATEALQRAGQMDPPPPPWTFAWLSGEVALQQGQIEEAARNFRSVLYDQSAERIERGFDFSADYVVRNQYGITLRDLATQADFADDTKRYNELTDQAIEEFKKVLEIDSENFTAYSNLADLYAMRGQDELAESNRLDSLKYKVDDNARMVTREARKKYPAADKAANPVVIYSLHRDGAYGAAAQ